jgi:hypothetical protein
MTSAIKILYIKPHSQRHFSSSLIPKGILHQASFPKAFYIKPDSLNAQTAFFLGSDHDTEDGGSGFLAQLYGATSQKNLDSQLLQGDAVTNSRRPLLLA